MRKKNTLFTLVAGMFLILGFVLAGCSSSDTNNSKGGGGSSKGKTLAAVKDRGKVVVGVNNALPGFGYVNEEGKYEGFDVDFGKALAAAIFDDPNAIEFRPLSADERFTALQSGDIDVLIRNTTWTTSRDTDNGANFGPVTFYDGQGIMVPKKSGIKSLKDLEGARIGVQTGTTTELNLADQFRKLGIKYEPVVFNDADSLVTAYEKGSVDAWTTDKSGLVSRQSTLSDPNAHVILDATLSKEPLGPSVAQGDDQWYDIVTWVTYATMEAEELGINSKNVDDFKGSKDPVVRRLLGAEGGLGKMLGLTDDFAYRVIKHVGNYSEIYNRNLGPDTVFHLERGQNESWTNGGLLYSPPFR